MSEITPDKQKHNDPGNPAFNSSHQNTEYFDDYASSELSDSHRILSTPSVFARTTLLYIQEIGKLKSLTSHTSQRKLLDSYLFAIVLSGKGVFTYNENTYHVSSGDHLFINCTNPYSHRSSDDDPWELMWVHFNGPLMKRYYSFFYKQSNSILFHSSHLLEYSSILEKLMVLSSQKKTDSELLISNLLNSLITLVLTEKSVALEYQIDSELHIMELVKNYLDDNYQKKLTLDMIAANFYISKYHMVREFKKTYDVTVINYIITKRITHAKGLLRFSDMHIEEIAQICGIEDNSYFNKVFRKIEGITASEYRDKWKSG